MRPLPAHDPHTQNLTQRRHRDKCAQHDIAADTLLLATEEDDSEGDEGDELEDDGQVEQEAGAAPDAAEVVGGGRTAAVGVGGEGVAGFVC